MWFISKRIQGNHQLKWGLPFWTRHPLEKPFRYVYTDIQYIIHPRACDPSRSTLSQRNPLFPPCRFFLERSTSLFVMRRTMKAAMRLSISSGQYSRPTSLPYKHFLRSCFHWDSMFSPFCLTWPSPYQVRLPIYPYLIIIYFLYPRIVVGAVLPHTSPSVSHCGGHSSRIQLTLATSFLVFCQHACSLAFLDWIL